MAKLQPCRCGGEVKLYDNGTEDSWQVQCFDCGMCTPLWMTHEQAIDTWNKNVLTETIHLACKGCKYEWACPSHEKCHGCARMYNDNYDI